MKVAAVVPAYNEADRLGFVLEAIRSASLVDEVVVVNDASTDETAAVARRCEWVRLVDLKTNLGKGGAMCAGASCTDADFVVFLDADLTGITGEQIDSIVRPVAYGEMDMCIGVFRGGRRITDWAQVIAPYISGQRALPREMFLSIPGLETVRSGVEVAITKHFRANGCRMGTVTLTGCSHAMKEEKLGYVRGFLARIRMYYDIGKFMIGGRPATGKKSRVVRGLRNPSE